MRNHGGRVTFLGSFAEDLPEVELPEVAFAGRSNVGKSSCLNRLLGSKKVARVSGRPGRTQRINLFDVAGRVVFADLPGYGFAKVPDHVQRDWKGIIEGYLGERRTLRLVVVLVDSRLPPQEMDGMLIYGLRQARIPFVVVATKVDKLKRSERRTHLARLREEFNLAPEDLIGFSATKGDGLDALWDVIEDQCSEEP